MWAQFVNGLKSSCVCDWNLHQVLIPDLAELHEVRLEAVHLLVDLPVVRDLLSQVLLQLTLAVVDLLHARLQTLRVALDPELRK